MGTMMDYVSHLLFEDDTILLCDANTKNIIYVRLLMICFKVVIGLKFSKSDQVRWFR